MMDYVSLLSEEIGKLWTGWEIRIMILLSLLVQIILIHYGSQRKYRKSFLMRMVVWSAYMVADSVATFTLGNIAKIQVASGCRSPRPIDILQVFWAPFLLLHMGGPDTITAYSLEDNELWKRHLLQLVFQVSVASYAIFWSWSNSILKFLAVPIFFVGCSKFAERTYALWVASTDTFKDALLSANPFKDNAERIVMAIKDEGFLESNIKSEHARKKQQDEGDPSIDDAYYLFQRFKYLFAGLTLGVNERNDCYEVIHQKSAVDAFKLIAIELGFMYDVIYTKATIIYSRWGILLRIISFGTTIFALVIFLIFIGLHAFDDTTDSFITFVLLGGAVALEVYAFIAILSSDWTKRWLFKLKLQKSWMKRIRSFIYRINLRLTNDKRWSVCMAQFSLLSYCLDDVQGTWFGFHKISYVKDWIKQHPYLTWKKVTTDMQEAIFKELKPKSDKTKEDQTVKSCKELLAWRGDEVLRKWKKDGEFDWSTVDIDWSTVDIEFDHSILVWHIATDICYFVDFDGGYNTDKQLLERRRISKCLSDYMLYLLVLFPSMLPEGIGEIRFRDTCAEVERFLKKENEKRKIELCRMLIKKRSSIDPPDISVIEKSSKDPPDLSVIEKSNRDPPDLSVIEKSSGDASDLSVLSDGCRLARQLQSLEISNQMDCKTKWKMISEVWIEMLTYAANRCRWKEHAQQLWKGGELLTHVCLLMTNLGLSEYYTNEERFLFI